MQPALLWFRRDLRLSDNAALLATVKSGRPVIPCYVFDEGELGGASRWWLHHSLQKLDASLRQMGSALVLRSGSSCDELRKLAKQSDAATVFYTKRYEPSSRRQEQSVAESLPPNVDIQGFDDSVLQPPERLLTKGSTPYRVFTPFWKAAVALGDPPTPAAAPKRINFANHGLESIAIAELDLLPTAPDWSAGLQTTWSPGESSGLERLDELSTFVKNYEQHRDRPDIDGTSRLSPHLHFGEISVRQVWHTVQNHAVQVKFRSGAAALLRQLYWRDFSSYLLFHFPSLPTKPLRPEFDNFPWQIDESHLDAWRRGTTGYPIVDAGMRQLRESGWMHNRIRMIAASFLVKDLLIPWQIGADWFLDNLVDADLANNSASWQWVAGSGTDAAPYFRIFNPTLQSKKFDPNGQYIRRWIPELGNAASTGYPDPIVDHAVARKRALEAYQSVKGIRTSKHAP